MMQTLADESPDLSFEEQMAFNVARWAELIADPQWESWDGRFATDEFGHILLMPIPPVVHGAITAQIGMLLQQLLGETVLIVCPISTAKGVKCVDVAGMSGDTWMRVRDEPCLRSAPPICIEVVLPGDHRRELEQKKALYFEAGAVEVWVCDAGGKMAFFHAPEEAGYTTSRFCPAFPAQVAL